MRLDTAAVDGKLVRNGTGGREILENALPDMALKSTIGAVCRRSSMAHRLAERRASGILFSPHAGCRKRLSDRPRAVFPACREADGTPTPFHASSDSQKNSLPCPLPPATQVMQTPALITSEPIGTATKSSACSAHRTRRRSSERQRSIIGTGNGALGAPIRRVARA